METLWCVDVTLSNGKALAIGSDFLSGSADLTETDFELIREAGKSLLAFAGEPPNDVNRPDADTIPPNICIECGDFGPHCNKCNG